MKWPRTSVTVSVAILTAGAAVSTASVTSFGADAEPQVVAEQKPLVEPEAFEGARPERTFGAADYQIGGRVLARTMVRGAAPEAEWHCTGDLYEPGISWNEAYNPPRKGIYLDGHQRCAGSFGEQRLCIKLQEKDATGSWYQRTNWMCNAWTVNPVTYTGRWVSCKTAQQGYYRTRGRGSAAGPPPDTGYGHSAGEQLCNGF